MISKIQHIIDALKLYTHNDDKYINDNIELIKKMSIISETVSYSELVNDIVVTSFCVAYDLFYTETKDIYLLHKIEDVSPHYYHVNESVLLFNDIQINYIKYVIKQYCSKHSINNVEFGESYIKRTS